MKFFRSLLAVVFVLCIGLISCSKSSTGPTGATGPVGPTGPAGPDSVTYSPWFDLLFAYNSTDSAYEDTLSAPAITQNILDYGVILTYVNFLDNNNNYHVVPLSAISSSIFEDYSLGHINIVSPQIDFSGLPYRYVVIPGSISTNGQRNAKIKGYTPQQLKAMSYAQVQQVLASKN